MTANEKLKMEEALYSAAPTVDSAPTAEKEDEQAVQAKA